MALELAKRSVDLYPNSVFAHLNLAQILVRDLHNYSEAHDRVVFVLEHFDDMSSSMEYKAKNLMGWIARYEGDIENAVVRYGAATEVLAVNHSLAY